MAIKDAHFNVLRSNAIYELLLNCRVSGPPLTFEDLITKMEREKHSVGNLVSTAETAGLIKIDPIKKIDPTVTDGRKKNYSLNENGLFVAFVDWLIQQYPRDKKIVEETKQLETMEFVKRQFIFMFNSCDFLFVKNLETFFQLFTLIYHYQAGEYISKKYPSIANMDKLDNEIHVSMILINPMFTNKPKPGKLFMIPNLMHK